MTQGMVTAISARIVVEECRRRGLDAKALGLDTLGNQIDDLAGRIPVGSMCALWERAVQLTADPMFAIRTAEGVPIGIYRVLDSIFLMSSSAGDALARSCRSFSLMNTAFACSFRISGELAYLELSTPDHRQHLPRPYIEYLLAIHLLRLRFSAQASINPLEVHFTHGCTALAKQYQRIFGSLVKFRQSMDCLVFPRQIMNMRQPFADPELCDLLEEFARKRIAIPQGKNCLEEIYGILAQNVESEAMTLTAVSRQLAKSTRNLQREICSRGTTFRELVDNIREKHARGLLKDTSLTLTEIADRMHFADASSFCRAFQRWTGISPAAYRKSTIQVSSFGAISQKPGAIG